VDAKTWAVDGAPGEAGLLTDRTEAQATYTAPKSTPPYPIAVSVETKSRSQLLVTNITVGDAWYGYAAVTLEYTGSALPGFTHMTATRAEVTWVFDQAMGYYRPLEK
jgi:hypothetical protein